MLILLYFVDARALFERVIGTFPPERARPLWDRWARYEYQFGDLAAAQKLEKRIAEVYPTGEKKSLTLPKTSRSLPMINRPTHQTLCRASQVPWH